VRVRTAAFRPSPAAAPARTQGVRLAAGLAIAGLAGGLLLLTVVRWARPACTALATRRRRRFAT
jgi:hypothetical protein